MAGGVIVKGLKFIAQLMLFLLNVVLAAAKLFLLLFGLVARLALALVRVATP